MKSHCLIYLQNGKVAVESLSRKIADVVSGVLFNEQIHRARVRRSNGGRGDIGREDNRGDIGVIKHRDETMTTTSPPGDTSDLSPCNCNNSTSTDESKTFLLIFLNEYVIRRTLSTFTMVC